MTSFFSHVLLLDFSSFPTLCSLYCMPNCTCDRMRSCKNFFWRSLKEKCGKYSNNKWYMFGKPLYMDGEGLAGIIGCWSFRLVFIREFSGCLLSLAFSSREMMHSTLQAFLGRKTNQGLCTIRRCFPRSLRTRLSKHLL